MGTVTVERKGPLGPLGYGNVIRHEDKKGRDEQPCPFLGTRAMENRFLRELETSIHVLVWGYLNFDLLLGESLGLFRSPLSRMRWPKEETIVYLAAIGESHRTGKPVEVPDTAIPTRSLFPDE